MVESRLRQMVQKLEMVENLSLAHPFIKGFSRVTKCYNEQQAMDAAHGIFPPEYENPEGEVFRTVYTMTFYIGLAVQPKNPTNNAPRKLDISWPTAEYLKLVKGWEKYDENTMGIVVQYIKR